MEAVLTGDIINSRKVKSPEEWMTRLKAVLNGYGKAPATWQIFRGDSFQLKTKGIEALKAAYQIRAALKSIDGLDVRLAIGLGSISFTGKKITESSGEAFIHSGEAFDELKSKKKKLEIRTSDKTLDNELNTMLLLAEGLVEGWTHGSAEAMNLLLQKPAISQSQLAKELGISQPSVSSRLSVAHAAEVNTLLSYYENRIKNYSL
jgi:predicted XRE-type DNA-binding protein